MPIAFKPAVLLAVAAIGAAAAACGEASKEPIAPGVTFSVLAVTPATADVCTVAPGNTVLLAVTPRDQNGEAMTGLGSPAFSSSSAAVATVDAAGQVSGLAVGAAQITATLTASGTTRTGTATVTVKGPPVGDVAGAIDQNHPAPHEATITAAQLAARAAVTIQMQGGGLHPHSLALTAAQMVTIAAGCRVAETSSLNPHSNGTGAHTHLVTIN
jgi:hypothetical protein